MDYSEEGDWSLSWQHGSHVYSVHPTDDTYRQFVVILSTPESSGIFLGPTTLEIAIGNVA